MGVARGSQHLGRSILEKLLWAMEYQPDNNALPDINQIQRH